MNLSKRDRLLDTAERLFYEGGFHATGIDRLVREAGTVRMTLYHHFASKEALVAEVLERRHRRFLAGLDAAVAGAAPGAATLALVDAHGAWLRDCSRRGCILVRAMGEYDEHNPAIRDQAHAAKGELEQRVAEALARDGRHGDEALARRLFLVLEGSNTGVAVMGVEAALREARTLALMLLRQAGLEVSS